MKRFVPFVLAVLLVIATPGIALAWTSILERSGFRTVHGQTWVENYPRIQFYAGASEPGSTTYFRFAYTVRCQGGFYDADSGQVHDYPFRYWKYIVRIPQPGIQGRCTIRAAMRAVTPANTNVTLGVNVP